MGTVLKSKMIGVDDLAQLVITYEEQLSREWNRLD
jgi:hypothetical protein